MEVSPALERAIKNRRGVSPPDGQLPEQEVSPVNPSVPSLLSWNTTRDQDVRNRVMPVHDDLHRPRDGLMAIAARHGASNLRLFGSVLRGEEGADSDIDLLVDMAEDRGFGDYLGLVEELEGILARRVDLVIA
jgi:uncharacterized protein